MQVRDSFGKTPNLRLHFLRPTQIIVMVPEYTDNIWILGTEKPNGHTEIACVARVPGQHHDIGLRERVDKRLPVIHLELSVNIRQHKDSHRTSFTPGLYTPASQ
jgi:hypothetical protein